MNNNPSSYPTKTEREWDQLIESKETPDCNEFPPCPLNFEDETSVMCALWLIKDFEDTSFVEICGRVGLLRKQLYDLSPTKKTEEENK